MQQEVSMEVVSCYLLNVSARLILSLQIELSQAIDYDLQSEYAEKDDVQLVKEVMRMLEPKYSENGIHVARKHATKDQKGIPIEQESAVLLDNEERSNIELRHHI